MPFTKIVAVILMALMGAVVVLSVVELGYIILDSILEPPILLIKFEQVEQILSFSLWVLIALELLQSIRVYLDKETEAGHHVETVMVVSIIAVARKVIVLNLHEYEGLVILGLAAIIAALCGGYLMIRRTHTHHDN
jgi:uncharacterized membrane protein (DUF373 family)